MYQYFYVSYDCYVCLLKTTSYIEVQKCLFGTNGLLKELNMYFIINYLLLIKYLLMKLIIDVYINFT